MGIENFFTLHSGQNGLTQQTNAAAKSGAGLTSGTSVNGLNFLDIIVARLNALNSEGQDKTEDAATPDMIECGLIHKKGMNAEQLSAFTRKSGLTLSDILSTNPEVQAEVERFISATQPSADASISHTLGLNQQAFDDVLIPTGKLTAPHATDPEAKASVSLLELLQIDANAQGDQIAQISGKINALRAKVESIIQNGEGAVLTTNLTPDQITALQNAQDGEWPEELQGVNVILIALVQPKGEGAALTSAESAQEITELAGDDPALAHVLMLLKPQKPAQSANTTAPAEPPVIKGQANPLMDAGASGDLSDGSGEFDESQNGLKLGKGNDGSNKDNALAQANAKNSEGKPNTPPPFSAFLSMDTTATGGLYGLPTDALGFYDDLAASTALTGSAHSAGLTSAITQAPHASAAHPATQMMAFNLQKATDGAQNKTLTLELDPPELGRVEVRMVFDKDKSMKAHVITEKPETYMMLQRDASTLERALENSGLADGGLSFELAEQGFDFNGNNQRGGGHDQGGTGAGKTEDEMEIINTTMNWQIDAETGHVRYNILA